MALKRKLYVFFFILWLREQCNNSCAIYLRAACNGMTPGGTRSAQKMKYHNNILELLAVKSTNLHIHRIQECQGNISHSRQFFCLKFFALMTQKRLGSASTKVS